VRHGSQRHASLLIFGKKERIMAKDETKINEDETKDYKELYYDLTLIAQKMYHREGKLKEEIRNLKDKGVQS
jgi:hypothetical protein